jgi:hypothetical protein
MKTRLFFGSLFFFIFMALSLQAQPPRNQVLDDIEILENPEAVELLVRFNFPVRYLSHFPPQTGTELLLRLQPIDVAEVDRQSLAGREGISPPNPNLAGITNIIYAGDHVDGPVLVLRFLAEAHWQLEQGRDFRSVKIVIGSPFPSSPGEVNHE